MGESVVAAPKERVAVFTAGRFQPPTPGHRALFEKVIEVAEKEGGDAFIFPSYSVKGYKGKNIAKNPLSYNSKIFYLGRIMKNYINSGQIRIITQDMCETPCNNAISAAKHLRSLGYTKLYLVLGSDRAAEPQFQSIENTQLVPLFRNESKGGIVGMSGTKIRKAAMEGNVKTIQEAYEGLLNKNEQATLVSNLKRGIPAASGASGAAAAGEGGGKRKVTRRIRKQKRSKTYRKA